VAYRTYASAMLIIVTVDEWIQHDTEQQKDMLSIGPMSYPPLSLSLLKLIIQFSFFCIYIGYSGNIRISIIPRQK
jgi:hypothetical protein